MNPSTRTWLVIVPLALVAGAVLFVVTFRGLIVGTPVELVNGARTTAATVRIEAGGQVLETRNLAAGDSTSWHLRPRYADSFAVSGRLASGARIHGVSLGSITPGDPAAHRLTIQPNGTVRHEASTR